jgi:4-hydroxy-tetrahydrodipicolinate synthase
LPRIVGLKDASGDLARPRRLRGLLGDGFRLLSGDDATALDFLRAGGNGCISVVANVAPAQAVLLYDAWRRGNDAEADSRAAALAPLTAALFIESNPVPVKYALEAMGWMRANVRLPLCPASETTRRAVAAALSKLGLPSAKQPRREMA